MKPLLISFAVGVAILLLLLLGVTAVEGYLG